MPLAVGVPTPSKVLSDETIRLLKARVECAAIPRLLGELVAYPFFREDFFSNDHDAKAIMGQLSEVNYVFRSGQLETMKVLLDHKNREALKQALSAMNALINLLCGQEPITKEGCKWPCG